MRPNRWVMLAVMVACLAACSSPAAPRRTPNPEPQRLVASVTQFRYDEGTRHLKAGVTNRSDRGIRVSRATISWDGFAFPTVPVGGGEVLPGQTAAFVIAYGAPECARRPTGAPVLVAVVDGRARRLPLRVEDPGLLVRLHAKACAQERLAAVTSVRLRLATHTTHLAGEEYLPGTIELRRTPGGRGRVRVVDLGGSVLLDFVPRGGRRALPGELAGDAASLDFPVLLGSAHRCDPHARGQSSQTFLISTYVRLDREPTQRVVLPLSTVERDRLNGLLDRDCGAPGASG